MICPKCGEQDCDFFTDAVEVKSLRGALSSIGKKPEEYWICNDCGTKFDHGDGIPFASNLALDVPESERNRLQLLQEAQTLHYGNLANKSLLTAYKDYYYSIYYYNKGSQPGQHGKHGFKAIKNNKLAGILKFDDVSNILAYDDHIYFLNNTKKEEGELWRVKYNANEVKRIFMRQKPSQFLIYDGMIYYISLAQKQTLLRMDIHCKGSEIIVRNRIGYFTIYDGVIYYSNNDDKGNIYCAPVSDPDSQLQITYDSTTTVGISGGGLQISQSGNVYYRSSVHVGVLQDQLNLSKVDMKNGESGTFIENVAAFNIDGNRLFTLEDNRLVLYDNFEKGLKKQVLGVTGSMSLPVINVCGNNIQICEGLLYAYAPVYCKAIE